MTKVNLDALIPREDFAVENSHTNRTLKDKLDIKDLEKGSFFYASLRKPDFQRETCDWDDRKIASFIKSFLDSDLIPSIILWQAGQLTFVIDGAHRLSALIAWVNDDYGNGLISQYFFGHDVDPEQKHVAEQTKKYVNKIVGSYKEYIEAASNPSIANPDVLAKALSLGYISVQLQWVTGGAERAESSFFTINQQASTINDTEISLLKTRKSNVSIASRAIQSSGRGHKYWNNFENDVKSSIEEISKDINNSLFLPAIKNPIKTLDLPLAGKGFSVNSLSLIYDLVLLASSNNLLKTSESSADDIDGAGTLFCLKAIQKIIRRITTTHPSSLGLHPAVYFYSDKGRYQPTALMAWVEILKDFEKNSLFNDFIKARGNFESVLLKLKIGTNQFTTKYGSGSKGYKHLKDFYTAIFQLSKTTDDFTKIYSELKKTYPFLNIDIDDSTEQGKNFNKETKSEIFLTSSLRYAQKCSICTGYIHFNSMTVDHIQRKEDGGQSSFDNGQLAHPYCNTTFKN